MPGVSCVLSINVPVSKTFAQVLENMMKKLELLGGVKVGSTNIESAMYVSTNKQATCNSFQVVTNSEYPATCFVVNDKLISFTADLTFREFPGLLKGIYEQEKKLHIEGRGTKYRVGNFAVNFVYLFMGQTATVKGILLEVIFLPCSLPYSCRDVLRCFICQYFAELLPRADPSAVDTLFTKSFHLALQESQAAGIQTSQCPRQLITGQGVQLLARAMTRHTMSQYIEHMNALRSLLWSAQSARSSTKYQSPVVIPRQISNTSNSPSV